LAGHLSKINLEKCKTVKNIAKYLRKGLGDAEYVASFNRDEKKKLEN